MSTRALLVLCVGSTGCLDWSSLYGATWVDGTTAWLASATSEITVAAPRAAPGDVLLAALFGGKIDLSVTPPDRFSLLNEATLSCCSDYHAFWFTKVAQPDEPPSYSFQFSPATGIRASVALAAYRHAVLSPQDQRLSTFDLTAPVNPTMTYAVPPPSPPFPDNEARVAMFVYSPNGSGIRTCSTDNPLLPNGSSDDGRVYLFELAKGARSITVNCDNGPGAVQLIGLRPGGF